ncbi:unnamed protein product [Dibothriocephalus latus]|uniref:Uncharacterized protein n=1 Tax=Dibothriocephalus latus TaxID=60516 RepID=A0A3P6PIZ9_DIBLA|nr:unnamed protein product [Dibothriocephalus latus]
MFVNICMDKTLKGVTKRTFLSPDFVSAAENEASDSEAEAEGGPADSGQEDSFKSLTHRRDDHLRSEISSRSNLSDSHHKSVKDGDRTEASALQKKSPDGGGKAGKAGQTEEKMATGRVSDVFYFLLTHFWVVSLFCTNFVVRISKGDVSFF